MVTVYTYFYKQKSRLLMEAAGPLFYSFSDFELVLIAAFANQIANANIVLDGRRRICVVLVDGTSARSTIEFFVGMNHDVAMPVLRWGVRRILLLDEIYRISSEDGRFSGCPGKRHKQLHERQPVPAEQRWKRRRRLHAFRQQPELQR